MLNELVLPHGTLALPNYLPDATRAVVRSIDSADIESCGIDAVVMNTFHLMQRPGSSTIHALGGLHEMAGWQRPIVTDSGGFQIYSLIRQNSSSGSISSRGATFQVERGARKFQLAPEKSIQLQMAYGADIIFCLDDPTHVSDPYDEQVRSVERTLDWAKRSRREYDSLLKQKRLPPERRPLLFAIIQGGDHRDLRRHCADVLLEIGFDGFGYGGWPLDDAGQLVEEALAYTRELVPPQLPLHGLGVASPSNVARCAALGYDLFDGAMPTRDARHGRLYDIQLPATGMPAGDRSWLRYVYATDDRHIKSKLPASEGCDCPLCSRYSLGYLRHLFDIKDSLAMRLATMHNLRMMACLSRRLQEERQRGG